MGKIDWLPEWAEQDAVMLCWPDKTMDWAYMIDDVEQCYVNIASTILKYEPVIVVCNHVSERLRELQALNHTYGLYVLSGIELNDTWARDIAPISVLRDGVPTLLDFRFNGWGNKFDAEKDNKLTHRLYSETSLFRKEVEYVSAQDFVCEGGAIETDGMGTVMTTKSVQEEPNRNPQLTSDEIDSQLSEYLGADRVVCLSVEPMQGDDTDGHIDTLARFTPNNTIVYVLPPKERTDSHYLSLKSMEEELTWLSHGLSSQYKLIGLPFVPPIYDHDSQERLPATYANFLIVNGAVIMPIYGTSEDSQAREMLRLAFPNRAIETVNCLPLIRQHGSLHCVTMQFPKGFLNLENINKR